MRHGEDAGIVENAVLARCPVSPGISQEKAGRFWASEH
jgi:hypothetical protein